MDASGHVIAIALDDINDVPAMMQVLSDVVSEQGDLRVLGWEELVPGLKQAIQADMTSAWFMYSVLIILVAFSVLNTQLMSVLERTREFGVIMALGVMPRQLAMLILLETFLMALLGLVIGVILGVLVAGYYAHVGFAYPGMDELTTKFNMPSVMYPSMGLLASLLGPSVVFVFCLFAAIYPALKLYRLHPVEAMRAV